MPRSAASKVAGRHTGTSAKLARGMAAPILRKQIGRQLLMRI